jgi:outer membrane protein, multidrug efflux system
MRTRFRVPPASVRRPSWNRRAFMKTRQIVIAIGAALLTACTVGPNYRRPALDPPATFRGTPAAVAPVPGSLADLKWFEVFKDEQLQGMIRTAFERNYDLRDAVARVEAARANLGITRADQFPTIDASAGVNSQRIAAGGAFPLPQGFDQTRTVGSVALNLLSFELDVWGRLRRATEAARADLLASEENRKAVVTTLVSDVAGSYFDLLALDMELAIAKRTLATRQESLNLIRIREESGLATVVEVRQGEQLVYGAAQAIPTAERLIEQTENQISLLLGGSPDTLPRGRSLTEQEQPPSVPPGLPSSLLERRPDIRAAEQNLIAANAIIGVAKAAYFPRISLTGFLGFQSDSLANLFSGPARVWQFAPQVTQPIFNAGRLKSNVRLAEAQQQIALIDYERTIQTAFREVSDALIANQKVREVRAQQEQLVATLQDRSRLSYMRYRGGVDTLLNALDADRDLFEAELVLARTQRDELIALVQLYRALGGGWQA